MSQMKRLGIAWGYSEELRGAQGKSITAPATGASFSTGS